MADPRIIVALMALVIGGAVMIFDLARGDQVNEATAAIAAAFTTTAVALAGRGR